MDEARQLREFWFGSVPLSAEELAGRMQWWFGGEPPDVRRHRDAQIRIRFGGLLERAARGELDSWADSPRRRLSLIVLLDQSPRNIYRGTARAFAFDAQALELALSGVQSGADAALDPVERMFFYMPLQHAESLDVQDESVAAYRRLVGEAPEPLRDTLGIALSYAESHRQLIERFGRFPHRNRILGRASTPEEVAWLKSGAESFGQSG
jgi:uncharacterized protein (DUF924 family)